MPAVTDLDDATFDEAVKASDTPVLVDFWAEWCGPCRPLEKVLHDLAAETDAIRVARVDIDDQPSLAARHGVMSVPTMIVFVEGREARRLVGLRSLHALKHDLSGLI